jgi:hypothetical protein
MKDGNRSTTADDIGHELGVPNVTSHVLNQDVGDA